MGLNGKSAVVTGGGRGIGRAVALALADAGVSVVVAARTEPQVQRVAADISAAGHRAWSVACDVSDPASVTALAQQATEYLGQIDILINNAGVASSAPVQKLTLDEWNRMLAVNATGPFLCAQAFVPGMVERRWGRIVNVASVAALTGAKYIAAYAASKHAVLGFTRCLAAEVAQHGVTVNAICPGYVDTDMTTESIERITSKTGMSRDSALASILETSPQGRLIEPEEVAHLVVSLCAADARGVNGQAIVVDGGELLA